MVWQRLVRLKWSYLVPSALKGCFLQLRNITRLKPFSVNDRQIVTNALLSSQLDYCNALYLGISQSSLSRLLTGSKTASHPYRHPCPGYQLNIRQSLRFSSLFLKLPTAWCPSTYLDSSAPFPTPDLSEPQTSCSWLSLDRGLQGLRRLGIRSSDPQSFGTILPFSIKHSPSADPHVFF